jgi:hypothetical protein
MKLPQFRLTDFAVTLTACVRVCPPTVADTVPLATIRPDQIGPGLGSVTEKTVLPSSDLPENDHCVTVPPVAVQVIELPRVRVAGEQDRCGEAAAAATGTPVLANGEFPDPSTNPKPL